jgi:chromosomal replication initiator protein
MQGIGLEILKKNPSKKIFYCNSEYFLNELIEAIRTGAGDRFRQNYRKLDVLIIDDIQFITKSPKTQEELFHTFNTLYQSEKQIILASDRPPKEIDGLTDRLKSRFEGGMVCDIQSPDYETRMAIILEKVKEMGVQIPNEYIELIADNIESNVRDIEGAITKIATTTKLLGTHLTEEDILKMLAVDIETKRKKMSPAKVIEVVSEVFDVTIKEIKGKKRTAYIALARQVIMYILRDVLEMPLEKVAKEVNRKDHTTVLHACEKIQDLAIQDKRFNEKIEKCKNLLAE